MKRPFFFFFPSSSFHKVSSPTHFHSFSLQRVFLTISSDMYILGSMVLTAFLLNHILHPLVYIQTVYNMSCQR